MNLALALKPKARAGGDLRQPVQAFALDPDTRDVVASVLQDLDLPPVVETGGAEQALSVMSPETSPERLIVDFSESEAPEDDLVALSAVSDIATRIIAVGTRNDVGLYRRLIAAGACDYLVKPVDHAALRQALIAATAPRAASASPEAQKLARVHVALAARGGLGATTALANLAWILAEERKQRVALVDLDLHFGTAALALDVEPSAGLREALEQPGRVDQLFVDRAMVKRGERLFVLGGEEALETPIRPDPTGLDTLLAELGPRFDHILIDLPRHATAFHAAALGAAADVLLFCDVSLAGVRDAVRIESMIKRHASGAKVRCIACETGSNRGKAISPKVFEKAIGHKVDRVLPFDAKLAAAGASQGKPLTELDKKSVLVKTLREIATDLAAGEKPAAAAAGFWKRWMR